MMKYGRHYLVSGRVQGVFYRANTKKTAVSLKLTGWVQNLPDGRVEVKAFGTTEQLEQFGQWLWQGPPAAKVDQVESLDIPWQEYNDFLIMND